MKKIAISACLLGEACRYDGTDNRDDLLLEKLEGCELIPFCPEDDAFGTPRPTMDLIEMQEGIRAISNETGEDLSAPVEAYAKDFLKKYSDIDLFIGKDRSPSCGVCSAKLYDEHKVLISAGAAGLMAKEAMHRGIEAIDAEAYIEKIGDPTEKDKH
ncbi:DUF523 domain-containing protein [Sulfurovum sp. NBC37-1]|uniref:DUF523 domain-containing protein n=1 Tax=Sulfurovum sp. (strain NBC37-1) TaxID=387093 RepID=UPI0001587671|nr:DUF523 domain-containing protein [Sulfurovum sp. NBC37-1]BAF71270.1 conserved hypothetical protein [Sulfurovum sp. NBC37-1]